MEYIVYCDESSSKGEHYSDFFGGCMLKASRQKAIEDALNEKKRELNMDAETKWSKVTANYLEKYSELIRFFFKFVQEGDIHVRIMFRETKNQYARGEIPTKDERYFKLYYQFLKHAFGFKTSKKITGEYYVHFLMDELPDHTEKADAFKRYLCALPMAPGMEESGMHVRMRDIGEVHSHEHVILQCVDIILGAMQFRLNRLHKEIVPGANRRGKRTIAKEKLYKVILGEINEIHNRFNIGVSTGFRGQEEPHWFSYYEHWAFVPKELFRE